MMQVIYNNRWFDQDDIVELVTLMASKVTELEGDLENAEARVNELEEENENMLEQIERLEREAE